MVKLSLENVLNRVTNVKDVIIVGAGVAGKELYNLLQERSSVNVLAFFDNNKGLQGKEIQGIPVVVAENKGNECVYIITVNNSEIRKELRKQLEDLGIRSEQIITYFYQRDYEYLSTLDSQYYQAEISDRYESIFGKQINWEDPKSYTEIINWEKLNVRDERRTQLADKYLVREWVKEKIGEEHLTKLYGVWDNVEEINFDVLPNSFVLKPNHCSGHNIIVKDKTKININEIRKKLKESMNLNYAYTSYEFHYKNIVPRIVCEEFLDGVAENIYDYNIYCFHGEVKYIWCIKGSHRPGCQASFYNKEWEIQPFSFGYPKDPVLAPKPDKLKEMLELSRILCKDFEHVRVDWYNLPDGRVLFGEMTFASWAGLRKFVPEEYDTIWGSFLKN